LYFFLWNKIGLFVFLKAYVESVAHLPLLGYRAPSVSAICDENVENMRIALFDGNFENMTILLFSWYRICEICGEIAKNVTGVGDAVFLEEWNDRDTDNSSGESPTCWRSQPLCNFLMACMVVAFILPWFFRVSMF